MIPTQITQWCHHFIRQHVQNGDLCIDATMGNGQDTALLCQLVGETGHVLAFDIQEIALENTKRRLEQQKVPDNYTLLLQSHVNMDAHAKPDSISCIMFNFGYLPGGDHANATQAGSSITAIKKGLSLLKKGGLMSLCIYSGGDTGFEERNTILDYIHTLDPHKYLVILSSYYNRPNHPPIPVLITRL
ncbi:MAG: class I SAM-dependent methyltransferase [Lachnospiraceae bacterium]